MCSTGKCGSDDGFTLLELLVVMVLLSLAAVIGALSLPDIGDRLALARSASRIERALSRLAADASHSGLDRTAVVTSNGTRQTLEAGDWIDHLDSGTTMNWIAAAEAGSDGDRGMIIFFGTGGATGGKLELARGNARATVDVDWLTASVRVVW